MVCKFLSFLTKPDVLDHPSSEQRAPSQIPKLTDWFCKFTNFWNQTIFQDWLQRSIQFCTFCCYWSFWPKINKTSKKLTKHKHLLMFFRPLFKCCCFVNFFYFFMQINILRILCWLARPPPAGGSPLGLNNLNVPSGFLDPFGTSFFFLSSHPFSLLFPSPPNLNLGF